MQFLKPNQGYAKFNIVVRHNIKYEKNYFLTSYLISETMTWGKLCSNSIWKKGLILSLPQEQ
jgi:hypothetical protein